jgi:hypothetical protein
VDSTAGIQDLLVVEKDAHGKVHTLSLFPVHFVPRLRGKR